MKDKQLNISLLKSLAKVRKIGAKEFAGFIGMSHSGWYDAEKTGDIRLTVFFKACEVLDYAPEDLVKLLDPNRNMSLEDFLQSGNMAAEPSATYTKKTPNEVLKFIGDHKDELLRLMEKLGDK